MKRLIQWLGRGFNVFAGVTCLGFLLTLLALIAMAPVPQIVSHVQWCVEQGRIGMALLPLTGIGVVIAVIGFMRRRRSLRLVGVLSVTLPIFAGVIARSTQTGEWIVNLSLLGACLFSLLLLYLFGLSLISDDLPVHEENIAQFTDTAEPRAPD